MLPKFLFIPVPLKWEKALYGPPYVVTETLYHRWVEQHLTPESVLLDIGAGPGNPYYFLDVRGRAKRVIGVDVDPAVLRNPRLDEAHVTDGRTFPLEDATVDLAVSTYVFEHLEDPLDHLREIARVLKPDGRLFFLTVNAHHPAVALYRMLPSRLRHRIETIFSARDPDGRNYPVCLRANSEAVLRRLARQAGFAHVDIRHREQPPHYFRNCLSLWALGVLYERTLGRLPLADPVKSTLYGEFRKAP